MSKQSNHPGVSRRAVLAAMGSLGATAAAALPRGLSAALLRATPLGEPGVSAASLAADPLRPQFHLLPARNWMNDPNGPVYYGGKYHMFHQYNPHAAVWGDMSWYHSVSPDMMHWTHLPLALAPTTGSPDAYGCFSGSALVAGKRVYQVYTGTRVAPSKELVTLRDGADFIQESQCLAYSDDPQLIHWTKLPQPIIPLPPPGMVVTGFRDPSVWKEGNAYYMTVGAGEAGVGGCVLLYRSTNLEDPKSWQYLHKLTGGAWNGHKTPNPCDDGEMWECPDFFALDGAHVLIYSTLGKVSWQSGELDQATMTFHAKQSGELDLGAFYAPKTQLDAHGRRILWGWIQEKRSDDAMRAAGWSGMMGLPRVMHLDKDGRLRLTMLPELSTLRRDARAGVSRDKEITQVLHAASGELFCAGARDAAFDLTLRTGADGSTDLLRASYSAETHTLTLDGKQVTLQPGDQPTLHAYVDGSVLEVIAGERIGYTKRFYYTGSAAPDVAVSLTHTAGPAPTLRAWAITPISADRLTTPAADEQPA